MATGTEETEPEAGQVQRDVMAPEDEGDEWPPKFTVNPEGVAALFLMKVNAEAGREEQEELADLFRSYFRGGQHDPNGDTAEPRFDREP